MNDCVNDHIHLSDQFLQGTLNALASHIAILDRRGTIVAVNAAWNQFAAENGLSPSLCGPGVSYGNACRNADTPDPDGAKIADALSELELGKIEKYYHEYPCHSPTEKRWFSLRLTRFGIDDESFIVVAHDNITKRKLAELEAREANRTLQQLASTDALSGIPNRRAYENRLQSEWQRHLKSGRPLAIAMVDIDCFKQYNDHYGHAAGDHCLRSVALGLSAEMRLPTDFLGRYGGEEFVAILADADPAAAATIAERLRQSVNNQAIRHAYSLAADHVSISIGLASTIPTTDSLPQHLSEAADQALYAAKAAGRNQVCFAPSQLHDVLPNRPEHPTTQKSDHPPVGRHANVEMEA